MDWEKVFGNLLTLTVALTAVVIMITVAVRAVNTLIHSQSETRKKDVGIKDL